MRGATGNNFGVLLSAQYGLQPLDLVYGWAIYWPLTQESDRQTAAAAFMTLQASFFSRSSSVRPRHGSRKATAH